MGEEIMSNAEDGKSFVPMNNHHVSMAGEIWLCGGSEDGLQRFVEGEPLDEDPLRVVHKQPQSQGSLELWRCEDDEIVDFHAV